MEKIIFFFIFIPYKNIENYILLLWEGYNKLALLILKHMK